MSNQQNSGHSWQPPLPQQPDHPKVLQSQVDVCYNFVWGICEYGTKCKYRHDLDISVMRTMQIFCRTFMRLRQCFKINCVCIHSTKQEVMQFCSKGKIPKALASKHPVLLSSSTVTANNNVQMSTQQSWPVGYTLLPPPPPPPQESAPSQTHPMPSLPLENPNYAGMCLPSTSTPKSQEQYLPNIIDTSRPPPNYRPNKAVPKRSIDNESEAGPSKVRRREEPITDATIQNNIAPERSQQCRHKLHDMKENEESYLEIWKKNMEELITPEDIAEMEQIVLFKVLAWAIKEQIESFKPRNVNNPLSTTPENTIVQSINALRHNNNDNPLNKLLEVMRNSSSDESQERAGPSAAYASHEENAPVTSYPAVAQNVCAGVATRGYPAPAPAPVYTAPQPPAPTYSAPQPPAPAYHPPYQPAVPPPARPYYAHQHYHNAGANAEPQHSTQYVYTQCYLPSQPAQPETPATPPITFPNGMYGLPPPEP